MKRSSTRAARSSKRPGFTLLELLVVIGLILFMMTVLVMTIGNAIGSAKENATRATLLKIDGLLQQRIDAFYTNLEQAAKRGEIAADAEGRTRIGKSFASYLSNNALIDLPSNLRPMLVRKYRFRLAFPQTGDSSGTLEADSPGLVLPGKAFAGNLPDKYESSEYLYYMLVQSDFFGVPPVDDGEFSSTEVGDLDNDGRPEFLDAWGNPLRFYRWSTRIIRPRGLSFAPDQTVTQLLVGGVPASPTASGDTSPLTLDPDDQLSAFGRMQLSRNNDPAQIAADFERAFHTLQSYHCPLVISAGRDGKLGLLEPYDRSGTYGYLGQPEANVPGTPAYVLMLDRVSDNITTRNVKTR
ncbi:type II secretion system protein [Planctellipticum variicoloris]|uniref:type II secretion system protein n=1 Tax=Planctellipticum variicoloris TaxID=3064265 RepID=UPI0030133F3D|nr:type II secretion system GspH family protein [Planctomycetaceae bacterium SH412]